MHADELDIDADLVRRLLASQFPQWADLPIERVRSAGTDNAIFRIGDDLVARLPRIHWATGQPSLEHEWLRRLAPHLPLAIPEPLAQGEPGEGYPWQWSVHRWLEGETATLERVADPHEVAAALGAFVTALQRIDPAGAPLSHRGRPLEAQDSGARAAIAALHDTFDPDELTAAWDDALETPPWQGPPTWFHGDLQSGNLLTVCGRLSAVIDARGRGWALSTGLIALPYYVITNPVLAGIGRRAIEEVLAERRRS